MKKILLIHNTYKEKGGEDIVFNNEFKLLQSYGNKVDKLIFDNNQIQNIKDKIKIGIFGIYNINSARILKNKIKVFRPDIIHIHNFFPIASPSLIYTAKKYKIPVILTLHNYRLICSNALLFRKNKICDDCTNKKFPYPALIHKCYRNSVIETFFSTSVFTIHKLINTWGKKVDKYITLTDFQKNKILNSSLNIPLEKLVVKPNFSEDFGAGLEKRENFFLYVGRLSQEKGILTILKAFKNNNINIKIVGDGYLREEVIKYAQKYKNIEYLGYKNKKEIINLMKTCTALIFPSEWYEGFPMVIVESLSTGTPIIVSDIGSQASIVNKKIGFHFQTGNHMDLTQKVKKFLQYKNKSFYINARKEYMFKYSPQKNIEQLTNIYDEVIYASQKKNH